MRCIILHSEVQNLFKGWVAVPTTSEARGQCRKPPSSGQRARPRCSFERVCCTPGSGLLPRRGVERAKVITEIAHRSVRDHRRLFEYKVPVGILRDKLLGSRQGSDKIMRRRQVGREPPTPQKRKAGGCRKLAVSSRGCAADQGDDETVGGSDSHYLVVFLRRSLAALKTYRQLTSVSGRRKKSSEDSAIWSRMR
jgi:hypothetical protein